ncbi:hypothetical protein PUMCH_004502 [Australozyma saopauloensis]|uniref:Uncharacterized protein n=1 Tax=Australozyma saopauloensis TaxID=291208 RepID=A0AAX4HFB5_9ASCO|nr:hypothetical protein PUMCH_004502 [[Candida] saopauloensis]
MSNYSALFFQRRHSRDACPKPCIQALDAEQVRTIETHARPAARHAQRSRKKTICANHHCRTRKRDRLASRFSGHVRGAHGWQSGGRAVCSTPVAGHSHSPTPKSGVDASAGACVVKKKTIWRWCRTWGKSKSEKKKKEQMKRDSRSNTKKVSRAQCPPVHRQTYRQYRLLGA